MIPFPQPFLKIHQISKTYSGATGTSGRAAAPRAALRGVSLEIFPGEIFALVGESGSGKTTLGRCILRFVKADAGKVIRRGVNLLELSETAFRPYRREMQMIFQHPAQALNPRQRVYSCLSEPLKVHEKAGPAEIKNRVAELLGLVGLDAGLMNRLPSQLSGGQRQRVAIARALALQPRFLIADEPTASLDAIHRRQIMELLAALRQKLRLTVLLITHDIALALALADRIGVMWQGQIVEVAAAQALQFAPKHGYSRQLLKAATAGFNFQEIEI